MIEDEIINIDVLEGLRSLPDSSIDLIVTSPPFNKGKWSLNRRQPSYTKRRHIDYGVFDDKMNPVDYEKWQREILDECCRVINPREAFSTTILTFTAIVLRFTRNTYGIIP